MPFIQLTGETDGGLVIVNAGEIEAILPRSNKSSVVFRSGRLVNVEEDSHEIANILSADEPERARKQSRKHK